MRKSKNCLLCLIHGKDPVSCSKGLFRYYRKNDCGTCCASPDFRRTRLRHGPEVLHLLSRKGTTFHRRDGTFQMFMVPSFPINILINIGDLGASKENICQPMIVLVCLWATACKKVGRNHLLDIIHHPCIEKAYTVLFDACSANVQCNFLCHNKIKIAKFNAG